MAVSAPPPPPPQPPPAAAIGLTERPTLADFSLPGEGTPAITLGQRYPGLVFNTALLSKPVPNTSALLVALQSGEVHTFLDDPAVASSRLVLDLTTAVRSDGEQGLLGIAFDPDFESNGHLFVHYTVAEEPRRGRIARYTWPSDGTTPRNEVAIDPSSEVVILEVAQPFPNHNGGSIDFGADGMLYIALGDGGAGGDPQNNAQNTTNLLGSVLRIDVRGATETIPYVIPDDNPWVNSEPTRGELWAVGLRNPFRMSFDEVTGELWAGDVGQKAREEVDIIVRGGNYGWRVREGTLAFDESESDLPRSAFTDPVIDLTRDLARSITGGDVYRGSRFPALNGSYIYGDFATENIWSLRRNSPDASDPDSVENTRIGSVPLPAHFGADTRGELVITSYTSGFFGLQSGDGVTMEPAQALSDTGLFTDLSTLEPGNGFIEYKVTEPHWSDGAEQRRWLAIPNGENINFSRDDPWDLPDGSLLLKQLDMPTQDRGLVRLETRLFVRRAGTWQPFTYVWNDNQSDATLTTGGRNIALNVESASGGTQVLNYRVPNQGECLSCHTPAAGTTLSTNTRQFNRNFDYSVEGNIVRQNQIAALNGISMFSGDVLENANVDTLPRHTASVNDDGTAASGAAVNLAARSYLDVNCANCHRPNGPSGSPLDLRASQALDTLNAVDVPPDSGGLGLSNARIIAPGAANRSVLVERMKRLGSERMPPVASNRVDELGVDLLESWINAL